MTVSRARRPELLWWLPIFLAGAYGLLVLLHFRELTAALYLNSDYAAAQVIAHALGSAPAGTGIVIGQSRWYEPLTFLWATGWVPFHRQIWDVTPLLCDLAALGILVSSARRAFDGWSAALTAAALICLGHAGLFAFLGFNSHGATAVHTVVLGAALVWLAPRSRGASGPRSAAGALARIVQ